MFNRLTARTAVATVALALLSQGFTSADAAVDADAPALSGRTEYSAAGSCWEIKQRFPDAPSNRYWIVTPAMPAPQKIFCDQTTDGGGWALVARGRDRWTEAGDGTVGSGSWMTDLPVDGRNGAMIAKQLPGRQIDALLNKGRVDALADGIRLRRAKNTAGTSWQELRFRFTKRDRWTWAFSARFPVNYLRIDNVSTRKAQLVNDLRINGADNTNRSFTVPTSLNNFTRGFNYGRSGPSGTRSADSYLYSPRGDGGYATPFTQMFIRPKLTRDAMSFAGIGDSGKAAVTNRPIASSTALPNTWGVKGLGAGGTDFNATEVSAFAQIGNTMYVGGNFTTVRNNATGQETSQPYLAAFNATTGAWIPGFRPKLNNQVKALAKLDDGRLAVGGQFTQVNGKTRRALVILAASSGATTSFNTDFRQTTKGARLWVRALVVNRGQLYVGGGFTQVRGGTRSKVFTRYNIARLRASDGLLYPWAPNLGVGLPKGKGKDPRSAVLSLSMRSGDNTIYAAGQFTQGYVGNDGRGAVTKASAAAITTGDKAGFRTWNPQFSSKNVASHYQQAVLAYSSYVWLGGSQHSMVKYKASNLRVQRSHLTKQGGDMQAITAASGVVYGSCHCNDFNYSDVKVWDNNSVAGFTQADRIGYVGAWDAVTGDYLPQFAPTSGTRSGEGPFALVAATDGTIWAGGDYTSIVTTNNKSEWAGGFVRFAQTPSQAPAAPTGLTAQRSGDYAYFSWTASRTAGVSYELLKDNRVIQTMGQGDVYSDSENYRLNSFASRFFVRAVDAAGNRSATTPVARVGGSTQSAARSVPQTPPDQTPPDQAPSEGASTVLLPSGSDWAVTAPGADGVDPAWSRPSYAPGDSWSTVAAPVGWGTDVAESAFDARPGTFYLRRDVTIDDPDTVGTVTIHTAADDGTAIYVNGVEVGRRNLPAGTLDGTVSATATPTGTDRLDWTITVPPELLVAGRNVVSAEVHPGAKDTKDVVFDLEVSATR